MTHSVNWTSGPRNVYLNSSEKNQQRHHIQGLRSYFRDNAYVSCSVVPNSLWPHGLKLPGSSVHRIRTLEWVAISFSRGLPDPEIEPGSLTLQAGCLPSVPPGWLSGPGHTAVKWENMTMGLGSCLCCGVVLWLCAKPLCASVLNWKIMILVHWWAS